ncbi:hypothetical protein KC19_4G235200 [Ceratodon purpureus]|uniref:Uncharacterized protein n=1 Tax=Ceratodon purpureus TaxID=3225 RepID=A0A8T0IFE0_CERPU|nr:hypothetical protein KC19_4G235200 [Ceratodon purpureus]
MDCRNVGSSKRKQYMFLYFILVAKFVVLYPRLWINTKIFTQGLLLPFSADFWCSSCSSWLGVPFVLVLLRLDFSISENSYVECFSCPSGHNYEEVFCHCIPLVAAERTRDFKLGECQA